MVIAVVDWPVKGERWRTHLLVGPFRTQRNRIDPKAGAPPFLLDQPTCYPNGPAIEPYPKSGHCCLPSCHSTIGHHDRFSPVAFRFPGRPPRTAGPEGPFRPLGRRAFQLGVCHRQRGQRAVHRRPRGEGRITPGGLSATGRPLRRLAGGGPKRRRRLGRYPLEPFQPGCHDAGPRGDTPVRPVAALCRFARQGAGAITTTTMAWPGCGGSTAAIRQCLRPFWAIPRWRG